MAERVVAVPRGRHAPPLEVRRERQRERLLRAAAEVFARQSYAEASAEAIAREAGMSKATFYEHFKGKEACILALWDQAAGFVLTAAREGADRAGTDRRARMQSGIAAFLQVLAEHPAEARTLLVEIIGAGPEASARRDAVLQAFAEMLNNGGGFTTFHDAFAVVGAIAELASRQVRLGDPADPRELEPVVLRLLRGFLDETPAPE
jgi:AcrR family transcriptional regulator